MTESESAAHAAPLAVAEELAVPSMSRTRIPPSLSELHLFIRSALEQRGFDSKEITEEAWAELCGIVGDYALQINTKSRELRPPENTITGRKEVRDARDVVLATKPKSALPKLVGVFGGTLGGVAAKALVEPFLNGSLPDLHTAGYWVLLLLAGLSLIFYSVKKQ